MVKYLQRCLLIDFLKLLLIASEEHPQVPKRVHMNRAIGGLRPIHNEHPLFCDYEVVGMLAQRVI